MKPGLDFSALQFQGRSDELKFLREALNRASGATETAFPQLVVVEGEGGTGKSALVTNFIEGMDQKSLLFGKGKFNVESTEPFSAIKECLQQITAKMDKDCFKKLSYAKMKALSGLVPALLAEEFGKPEECADDGSVSVSSAATFGGMTMLPRNKFGSNRLRFAIRSLVRTASKDRLVVFVLDDIQWAESESLQLLQFLLGDHVISKVCVIATARPLSVGTTPAQWLSNMPSSRLTRIQIPNLTEVEVARILSQLLRREEQDVLPLANMIYKKTRGNAFFVLQFIRRLNEQTMIQFSLNTYQWVWELERIHAETNVAENVVDLLSDQMHALPQSEQLALNYAAILGIQRFGLDILFQILAEEREQDPTLFPDQLTLMTLLEHSVSRGLLEKLGESRYKFSHDRIRESLAGLNVKERKSMHWNIGIQLKRLLKLSAAEDAPMLYDESLLTLLVVHHLNRGLGKAPSSGDGAFDIMELVRLNFEAGTLAFRQSSFVLAAEYLQMGIDLIKPEDRWTSHYELSLQLASMLADVLQCTGKLDESKSLIDEVLCHAQSLDDKLPVYRSLSWGMMLTGRYQEAVDVCLSALDLLDVRLPRRMQKFHIIRGVLDVKRQLAKCSDDELLHPATVDSNLRLNFVIEFTEMLALVSLVFRDMVYNRIAMILLIKLTLQHGYMKTLPIALAASGILHAMLSDFNEGNRLADLAIRAAEECDDAVDAAKGIVIANACVRHWRRPFHECLKAFSGCLNIFEDAGDIFQFFRCVVMYSMMYYLCGLDLRPLEDDMLHSLQMLEEYGQTLMCAMYQPAVQFILSLRGKSEDPRILTGFAMNEVEFLAKWTTTSHPRAFYFASLYRMILAYLFGNMLVAEEARSKLSPPAQDGPLPMTVIRLFFEGLIDFGLARLTGKKKYVREGKKYLKKLKIIYEGGNGNCHHMMMLLAAELASFNNQDERTRKAYDHAIVAAAKLGFLNNRALGNELAGMYFLRCHNEFEAALYFNKAFEFYTEWGAEAKAEHIKINYGGIMKDIPHSSDDCSGSAIYGRTRFNQRSLTSLTTGLPTDLP